MRIAFVTEVWLPDVNGVVVRLRATIEELLRSGHEVLVVAPRACPRAGAGALADAAGTAPAGAQLREVPTISVPFIYGGKPWAWPLPRVVRFLREFDPDVVHVVNPIFLGMAGVAGARLLGRALVASYHTDVPRYASYYHLGWASPAIWWVVRGLHNRAQVNLATSRTAQEVLRSHGIEDPQLWAPGVDAKLFRPERRPGARQRFTNDPTTTIALYVGRMSPEKNLDAACGLAETEGFHLVLVGEGPDEERLRRRLEGTSATVTGPLYGEELADVYAAADVFVFPSVTETLGLVILEAMATGVPVVAAETDASRELLGTCSEARLFSAGNPESIPELVSELLSSGGGAERDEILRSRVEPHTWAGSTRGLVGYYRQALATVTSRKDRRPRR